MARIQPGPLISDIRGKLGGIIFQGGRNGLTCKVGASKIITQSSSQQDNRSDMFAIANAWQSLTESQRLTWGSWSVFQNLKTGTFGTSNMTGQQAYIQVNRYRLIAGLACLEDPVFTPYSLGQEFPVWYFDSLCLKIVFSANITDSNAIPIVSFSPIVQPSRMASPSSYICCRTLTYNAHTWNFYVDYLARYGFIPAAGQYVFVKWMLLQLDNSTLSPQTTEKITGTTEP